VVEDDDVDIGQIASYREVVRDLAAAKRRLHEERREMIWAMHDGNDARASLCARELFRAARDVEELSSAEKRLRPTEGHTP
jgi:hypothetical protein